MAEHYDPTDMNAVLMRIETNQQNKAIVDAERWQKMSQWMTIHQAECDERGKRIEKLENWRWYLIGFVAGVGAVVGYFLKK